MNSQAFLARTMEFRIGKFLTKYLGVQLSDKQNRIANWGGLIWRIQKRMNNYTFIMLNIPSRLILLKSVLQAMPIYQMASQAIPKTIMAKKWWKFSKNYYGKEQAKLKSWHCYHGNG